MSIREVPTDFQRELDQFNEAQGGPVRIEIAWNNRSHRWEVWAVPIDSTSHPGYDAEQVHKLMRNFPDDDSRRGIKLFSWAKRDSSGSDVGYLPLDQRIFQTLRWADTFQDKDHFKHTMEDPAARRELAEQQRLRDIAGGAREYFWRFNNPIVGRHTSGDWRWRLPGR